MEFLLPPVNLGPVTVHFKLLIVPVEARDSAVGDPKEGEQDCTLVITSSTSHFILVAAFKAIINSFGQELQGGGSRKALVVLSHQQQGMEELRESPRAQGGPGSMAEGEK